MAYTIQKSNGDVLTTLIDGTLDDTTDLTLIGKNFTGYGEQINENFVRLLENFAGVAEPNRPIIGQLWFDSADARVKVYTSTGWKVAGGPIVTDTQPLNFNTGDLWVDNNENQLWFFDGSDLILAGPIWKRTQGKTGLVAETLYDASGNAKSVLFLYVANALLGIYSAEPFTPVPPINGFPTLIKGYTSSTAVLSVFSGTSTNSLLLNDLSSNQFMRRDIATANTSKILIQNNEGLVIGANQIAEFKVDQTTLVIENVVNNGPVNIRTRNETGTYYPFYVDSANNKVGIWTATPQKSLDVAGDLRVRGSLSVEGTNSIINSTVLQVQDKNIEIAKVETPTNLTADGAGIIIKGTTDKTIVYNNSTTAFDISESINLASGKVFRVNGVEVLSGSALSSAITSAPGITSIGPQVSLQVADLSFTNNKISSLTLNQDIELEPLGTGNISLIGSPRITGLGFPTNGTDACPKSYAEGFAKILPLSISLTDIDGGLNVGGLNTNIIKFLNDVANAAYFIEDKVAFVHLQNITTTPTVSVTRYLKKFKVQSSAWVFDSDLTSSI